jgi:hypothetical protein
MIVLLVAGILGGAFLLFGWAGAISAVVILAAIGVADAQGDVR